MSDFVLTADKVRETLANTLQITFEITDACNLRCEYCAYGKLYADYDVRENKLISFESAKRFIDYMGYLWKNSKSCLMSNKVMVSFYGGEPLLNTPFIKQVISYLEDCDYNKKFHFNMTTNAMLLDKYMDFLVEKRFRLLVSLDGDEKRNAYRKKPDGTSSFQQVTKNVDMLRQKYPDYFDKYVNFNAVLHNLNSVNSVLRYIKDRYNKVPRIGDLNDTGIREGMKEEFVRMYRNSYDNLFQNENYGRIEKEMFMSCPTYRSAMLFLLHNSEFKYENYNELLLGKAENVKSVPTGTCLPFSRKVFITVNGKILPCERIGHQYEMGTVDENGVNIDFEKIASKYNEYYQRMKSQCKVCENRKDCIQCVFQIDGFDKGKHKCLGFMNKEQRKQYVATQIAFFARHPEAYAEIMKNVILK